MKRISTLILLLLFTTVTAQRKDDTAHVFAGLTIHSGSYFLMSAAQIKGKEWIPFVAVNAVGVGKELIDSGQPDNQLSGMDLVYDNIGAVVSWLMIKGLRAVGVADNWAVASAVAVGLVGLGLTINF